MREIKFRAWYIKRKKYYEVHHLHIGSIGIHEKDWATCKAYDCIEQKDIYIQVQPNECIIEQFTGLHDKNGKEIYEGDLIKYGSDAPLEVIYRESCFCYNQKSRYISRLQIFDNINKIEVIGNIHENPELLEGRE
jgi:hypothetical protein